MLEEDTTNNISYIEGDSLVNPNGSGKNLKKIDKISDRENRQMYCLRD